MCDECFVARLVAREGERAIKLISRLIWRGVRREKNHELIGFDTSVSSRGEHRQESNKSPETTIVDADNDGAADHVDNCPGMANPSQLNSDTDRQGDACDGDDDDDSVADAMDNCPVNANTNQIDRTRDGRGDACQDSDADSVLDLNDNCLYVLNADQRNSDPDSDDLGNACDNDDDGDGVCEGDDRGSVPAGCVPRRDNCPLVPNATRQTPTATEPAMPATAVRRPLIRVTPTATAWTMRVTPPPTTMACWMARTTAPKCAIPIRRT
ncbi:MAG: thrombospondin type 3 repeat-containing protein [Gemmatimonadaceae bacterium]